MELLIICTTLLAVCLLFVVYQQGKRLVKLECWVGTEAIRRASERTSIFVDMHGPRILQQLDAVEKATMSHAGRIDTHNKYIFGLANSLGMEYREPDRSPSWVKKAKK